MAASLPGRANAVSEGEGDRIFNPEQLADRQLMPKLEVQADTDDVLVKF
jgi:hypothetical protein